LFGRIIFFNLFKHFCHFSETEALEHYKKAIRTVNAKLPILFDKEVLQDEIYSVNVEPVPPNINSLAYYKAPSLDGKRKGTFFINFQNIAILKKYETMVLTLHEGNPGEANVDFSISILLFDLYIHYVTKFSDGSLV